MPKSGGGTRISQMRWGGGATTLQVMVNLLFWQFFCFENSMKLKRIGVTLIGWSGESMAQAANTQVGIGHTPPEIQNSSSSPHKNA